MENVLSSLRRHQFIMLNIRLAITWLAPTCKSFIKITIPSGRELLGSDLWPNTWTLLSLNECPLSFRWSWAAESCPEELALLGWAMHRCTDTSCMDSINTLTPFVSWRFVLREVQGLSILYNTQLCCRGWWDSKEDTGPCTCSFSTNQCAGFCQLQCVQEVQNLVPDIITRKPDVLIHVMIHD